MWESGKQFQMAPLLGMGGNKPGASDSIDFSTRGGGAVKKPLCDHALSRGHKGLHNIHNSHQILRT